MRVFHKTFLLNLAFVIQEYRFRAIGFDCIFVHRNLNPQTILVRHDNKPTMTGFEHTRIPSETSVGSGILPAGPYVSIAAPEVQTEGLAAADNRSDIFSLCASLRYLFQDRDDDLSVSVSEILSQGLAEKPNDRCTFQDLDEALAEMLGEEVVPPPVAPATAIAGPMPCPAAMPWRSTGSFWPAPKSWFLGCWPAD